MENLKHSMRKMFEQRNSAVLTDDEKVLADDIVGKIMNLSILNPSSFAGHTWGILSVKTQKSKYMLYKLLNNNEKVMQAAASLILTDDAKELSYPLAHMSIMYAAKYYGIDFFAISGVDFESLKTFFNIPPSREIVMIACLGYFDDLKLLHPQQNRLCYRDIVHEI